MNAEMLGQMDRTQIVAWLLARFPARQQLGHPREEALNWYAAANALAISPETLKQKLLDEEDWDRRDFMIMWLLDVIDTTDFYHDVENKSMLPRADLEAIDRQRCGLWPVATSTAK